MNPWRAFIIILVLVVIASALLGKLLEFAVLEVHPSIDPAELSWRVSLISAISWSIFRDIALLPGSRTATPTTTRPAFRRLWLLSPVQRRRELR